MTERMTGRQLTALRLRLGLTQAELAHRIGLRRMQTISGWEQRATVPAKWVPILLKLEK